MNTSYQNYVYYRNKMGLSDYAVSSLASLSKSTISDWKNGKHQPQAKTLKKIARLLNCEVNDFYINPQPQKDLIKSDNLEIRIEPNRPFTPADNLPKRISSYLIELSSGQFCELTADEYKELQCAINVFIDSWIKSKKGL